MEEELEVLESIYLGDDFTITRSDDQAYVSIKCCPRNEENQFVYVVLLFHLKSNYPVQKPVVTIPETFGIDEKEKVILLADLATLIDEADGESICFSLVEHIIDAVEKLNDAACCHICLSPLLLESPTEHNLPPALTQIKCLTTPCRHQYHSACLLFWWREYVVSKYRAEIRKGGEEEAVGRERQVAARQRVLEQTQQAAALEMDASSSILLELQHRLDALSVRNNKMSRSELASRVTEETEVRNELNIANQRVAAATSALQKVADRVEKSKMSLESAHQLAAQSSEQHESRLCSEIPCPVCRTVLKLEDTPIDVNRFMKNTKKKLAEEDEGLSAASTS